MSKLIKDLLLGLNIKEVKGNFYCSNNNLTSLEGSPKTVGGNFYCSNNTKEFTEEEVRKYCDVKGRILI